MRERLGLMVALVAFGGFASGCTENPTNCADNPCVSGATCIQQTYESFECVCPDGQGGDGTSFCAPLHTVTGAASAGGPIAGGETITITGTGFADPNAGETVVYFGSAMSDPATVTDDTTLTVMLPPGNATGPVDLTVVNALGEVTLVNGFTYFLDWLYVNDGSQGLPHGDGSKLYRVNPVTAEYTEIADIMLDGDNVTTTGLAFDPSGVLYAVESTEGGSYGDGSGDSRLFTIDVTTGVGTNIGYLQGPGGTPSHAQMPDITFRDGVLFGWTESGDDPVTIDTSTAEVNVIGNSGISTAGSGMATSPAGTIFFTPGYTSTFYEIDPMTGLGTLGPPLIGQSRDTIDAMVFLDGVLYGVQKDWSGSAYPTDLITINPLNGQVTVVGPLPDWVDSIATPGAP